MDEQSVALSLATIEQIITELRSRYGGLLVVTDGEAGDGDDYDRTRVYYGGGRIRALGAAEWARQYLAAPAIDVDDCEEDE